MMDKIKLIPQFNEVLSLIRKARSRVLSVANSELVELYWQIGRYVSLRLAAAEWGKKSVEQLAKYLQIPWGHNITLLTKVKDSAEREWYAIVMPFGLSYLR